MKSHNRREENGNDNDDGDDDSFTTNSNKTEFFSGTESYLEKPSYGILSTTYIKNVSPVLLRVIRFWNVKDFSVD